MWTRTAEALPPTNEPLAVVHKLSGRGEYVDEEATWTGEHWLRCKDNALLDRNYYYLWRRLETLQTQSA